MPRHDVAGGTWRKSSRSGPNGDCVQVARGRVVAVRDSKDPNGPKLAFAPRVARFHARRAGGRLDTAQ